MGWDLQQRRPLPAAETGRSCWGSGQQDANAAQGVKQTLGAATRGTRQQPTGLIAYPAAQGRAVRFPCGLHETATTLDIPTGWDPNTKKEPTGLFFAACGRPCSFDSSYGLHEKIPDPKIRDFIHDPYGNRSGADRRQRRKQGSEAGAVASRMRVPFRARSSRWEPQPVTGRRCKAP